MTRSRSECQGRCRIDISNSEGCLARRRRPQAVSKDDNCSAVVGRLEIVILTKFHELRFDRATPRINSFSNLSRLPPLGSEVVILGSGGTKSEPFPRRESGTEREIIPSSAGLSRSDGGFRSDVRAAFLRDLGVTGSPRDVRSAIVAIA